MKTFFFLVFFPLMILCGCGVGDTKYSESLDEVCALLDSYSLDSAYSVLMAMSDAVGDMSMDEGMRYEVCRVSAKNKMFVSLKDEEETMQRAVEYYEEHGSPDEKMEACLLLGSVYRDMGDAPQALEWFDKAITHGQMAKDKVTLAKIHGQKADLFIKQRLFEEALVEVDVMKDISQAANEKSLQVNAMSIKSSVEYCLKRYESVINTYNEASDILLNDLRDTIRAAFIATSSISSYLRLEEYDKAKDLMLFYEQRSGLFSSDGEVVEGYESYYLDKGDLYVGLGFMDSSLVYYKKSLDAHELGNVCMSNYKLAKVYERLGVADSAFKYAVIACNLSQKYFEELQTNTLQQIEATYNYGRYKQESAEKTLEAERTRFVATVVLCVVLCVGVFVWIVWRQRKKREMEQMLMQLERAKTEAYRVSVERRELQMQLEKKMSMIEELQDAARSAEPSSMVELQKLQSEVDELSDVLAVAEDNYSKLISENGNILTALMLKANSEINVTDSDWNKLERHVKAVYPHFYDNLLRAVPNLNLIYVRIATLVKLDFSTTHIASLVCRSVTTVSNARRRMYEKAHGCSGTAELADEWIRGL